MESFPQTTVITVVFRKIMHGYPFKTKVIEQKKIKNKLLRIIYIRSGLKKKNQYCTCKVFDIIIIIDVYTSIPIVFILKKHVRALCRTVLIKIKNGNNIFVVIYKKPTYRIQCVVLELSVWD